MWSGWSTTLREVQSEQIAKELFSHAQRDFFSGITSWRVRSVRLPAQLRKPASPPWPSYKTIGAATQMSVNTVRKHVCSLADKGLISTEDTTVFTKTGLKRNGSLLYTIRPFLKTVSL